MTDLATPDAPAESTTLDPASTPDASGAGQPRTLSEPAPKADEKPEKVSLRDVIADEASKKPEEKTPAPKDDADKSTDKAKDAAKEEKGKQEDKGEEKPSEVAEKKPVEDKTDEKPAEQKQDEPKPADNTQHPKAPKSFLPDAVEKYTNVPRPVQRDIENMVKTHEQEVAKFREVSERYEAIRHYDEAARKNGRENGLQDTLREVAQLEDTMGKNPVAALNQILMRAGPRKPDGQPYSLFEVAKAIVQKGEQGYQQMVSQPAANNNSNAELQQLRQQMAQMQAQQRNAEVEAQVIAPFKASHPRYDELEGDIAFFLKSGKIPTSLSLPDRLEAAYDMAARINPASHVEPAQPKQGLDDLSQVDPAKDSSGTKSIKSAPGAVSSEMEPERGGKIRDVLEAELRRTRRA